ncbi:MAG: hypothetical protein GY798_29120 [Hyphomicrobiales bacterium]|nr:hypothetical protein [Hyphomicrobiales bacterium]
MATNAEKEMAENLDKLRADIAELSATVKTLVSDTVGAQSELKKKLDETARHAAAAGESILHGAAEKGNEALHSAAQQASHKLDEIEVKISRNPFTAVLIALGLGFVFGLMNRR